MLIAAVCALLTSAEIQRVQGEAPVQAKAGASGASESCFYELPTFTKSVSLDVTRGVRKLLDSDGEVKREPVRGLGGTAFWSGDPRLGGLYVLRRDTMLRLAVGGAESKAVKLRKLKVLARAALKRLFR
jgi:hypothetical protein